MKEYCKVVGSKVFTVRLFDDWNGSLFAALFSQSLNTKTGKGWQKHTDQQYFEGEKAHSKAMVAWLKRCNAAG